MSELLPICPTCNHPAKRITKGICHNCYRRLIWVPPKSPCKRCGRMRPIQAWGFCNGCYNSVFHIEKVKAHNRQNQHNIPNELYKKVVQSCVVCGFDKIIDLHHLDHNHSNNSELNLIGLCPNHHRMVHHRDFCQEVFPVLKSKGYSIPDSYEEDSELKKNLIGTIHKKRLIASGKPDIHNP